MKLNNRELEVMGILGAAKWPLTSTGIVNTGQELTMSTVQAVIRKTQAAGYVETVGITHSSNVLSRQFALTDKGKEALLEDLVNRYRKISGVVSIQEVIAALQQADGEQTGGRS